MQALQKCQFSLPDTLQHEELWSRETRREPFVATEVKGDDLAAAGLHTYLSVLSFLYLFYLLAGLVLWSCVSDVRVVVCAWFL